MGRVIKPGAQPKKHVTRKKTPASTSITTRRTTRKAEDDDDDIAYGYDNYSDEENESTALYSLDQTEMYVPPPIINGKVTRNAYGNIDVYVPSMIPEGGVLLQYPHIAVAAKMVGIDYANAVTGFDFGSKGGKKGGVRGSASARIDGIVIAKEYEEAVRLVYEQMTEEQEEEDRELAIAKALMMWRRYVTALRIKARLERDHGKVEEQDKHQPKVAAVYENEGGKDFIDVEENAFGTPNEESGGFSSNEAENAGGFVANESEGGGFVADDNDGGGFLNDNDGGGFLNDNESGGFVNNGGFYNENEDGVQSESYNDDTGGGFFSGDPEVSGGFVSAEDSGGGFVAENTDLGVKNSENLALRDDNVSYASQDNSFSQDNKATDEPSDEQSIKDSIISVTEPATLDSNQPENMVNDLSFDDQKLAAPKSDSMSRTFTPSTKSQASKQTVKARSRAFVPQVFDVVVVSDANPEDSLEERILKASKISSTVNSQQALLSSENTQVDNRAVYGNGVSESTATLVDNNNPVTIAADEDVIDVDDDDHKPNVKSELISEKEVNSADDHDVVMISDEEEGDFFPESMSESELYNEYEEEE